MLVATNKKFGVCWLAKVADRLATVGLLVGKSRSWSLLYQRVPARLLGVSSKAWGTHCGFANVQRRGFVSMFVSWVNGKMWPRLQGFSVAGSLASCGSQGEICSAHRLT